MTGLSTLKMVFTVSCIAPVVAMFVKPWDYAFYMFLPAVPHSAAERSRLFAANAFLVASAVAAVLSGVTLAVRAWQSKRWPILAVAVVPFLHPLLQPVFFERLDTELNYRWYRRAAELYGCSQADVQARLGRPSTIEQLSSSELVWNYKPLWVYVWGSKGQIVFTDGRVTHVEANDD